MSETILEDRVQSLHALQEESEKTNFSVSEQHKLDVSFQRKETVMILSLANSFDFSWGSLKL